MILIIGGIGSGKRSFARSLGYADSEMTNDVRTEKPVLYGLEETVFKDPENAPGLLDGLLKRDLVICCEVGSGVIPLRREERAGREAAGRLCVQLATHADAVIRMVAGIPVVIKGKMPCARS